MLFSHSLMCVSVVCHFVPICVMQYCVILRFKQFFITGLMFSAGEKIFHEIERAHFLHFGSPTPLAAEDEDALGGTFPS